MFPVWVPHTKKVPLPSACPNHSAFSNSSINGQKKVPQGNVVTSTCFLHPLSLKLILNLFHATSSLTTYSNTLKLKHNAIDGFQTAPKKGRQGRTGTDGITTLILQRGCEEKKRCNQPRLWYCASEFKQINIKGTHLALKWNLWLETVTI